MKINLMKIQFEDFIFSTVICSAINVQTRYRNVLKLVILLICFCINRKKSVRMLIHTLFRVGYRIMERKNKGFITSAGKSWVYGVVNSFFIWQQYTCVERRQWRMVCWYDVFVCSGMMSEVATLTRLCLRLVCVAYVILPLVCSATVRRSGCHGAACVFSHMGNNAAQAAVMRLKYKLLHSCISDPECFTAGVSFDYIRTMEIFWQRNYVLLSMLLNECYKCISR